MTIQEYYDIILTKYNSGEYQIRSGKHLDSDPIVSEKEFPLYALNYLIFEYMKDNKDDRWKLLLDFILVPNGVNQGDCDIDFTQVSFDKFFQFMISVKSLK